MKHGSMFSGILGFELGFALAGFDVETVWHAEIDPWCLQLIEQRLPGAQALGDVTTVETFPDVDVLTAGFPCQPVSQAGRGAAQDDDRWHWPAVLQAVQQAKPSLVILENVRGLRSRGLGHVLADLRDAGYDAQWDLIPAAAVGAPHLRHRFAIIAYPAGTHMGSIFDRTPPVFTWAPEEPFKPRLIKSVKQRKQRLSALGNAVVPQWVAYVALAVRRAMKSDDEIQPTSLFGHTVESYNGVLPYAGALIDGLVHEHDTVAPRLEGKRLWPTAAANDAEWGIDALRATVHVDGAPAHDPHRRLYHPETGQIVQRTLHNYVIGEEYGLWPTPQHADGNGKGARLNAGTQENGEWRSINLIDAVKKHEQLWPTATATDAEQSRRHTTAEASHSGTTLTDAAIERDDLWPTAAASDHKGVSQPGQRRGQLEEAVKTDEEFWPTPNRSDALGGRTTGAGRAGGPPLAAAVHDAQMWETPTAAPWSHGGGGGELVQQIKHEEGEPIGGWSRDGVAPDDPGKTLNPRWVEWLMGYPADWTVLEPVQQEAAA